jgi:hypothetical protein
MQKEEEILAKQNSILSKLEEVMSKISPEVNNQTTEDPAELKRENKRLTEEVDSLKKVKEYSLKRNLIH